MPKLFARFRTAYANGQKSVDEGAAFSNPPYPSKAWLCRWMWQEGWLKAMHQRVQLSHIIRNNIKGDQRNG